MESGRERESGLVVESGRVVDSSRVVESSLAVGLKPCSLERELVAGRSSEHMGWSDTRDGHDETRRSGDGMGAGGRQKADNVKCGAVMVELAGLRR